MNDGATTSFVTAGGYRLHLRQIEGERLGLPTLVFLHEGLGTNAVWGDFADALCHTTGCPAVLYERPGYGASEPPRHCRSRRETGGQQLSRAS